MLLPYLLTLTAVAPPPGPGFQAAGATPTSPTPTGPLGQLPPQREADTLPQDPGIYGTVHPEVGDIVLADTLVHSESEGRAAHQLLDLAGTPEHGFVAVWRDMRDGNAGLYFGRLDSSGVALEPERALYPEGSSSRELEPSIAIGARGNGAFVWYSSGSSAQSLKLRTFDAAGQFHGASTLLEDARHAGPAGGRPTAFGDESAGDAGRARGGMRLPTIALTEQWGAVGWGDHGALWIQRFDLVGSVIGNSQLISSPERTLAGPLRMCASPPEVGASGAIACAWTTSEGVEWALVGDGEIARRSLGAGVMERLVVSPAPRSGWWAMVQTNGTHRLIALPRDINGPAPAGATNIDLGFSPRDACDVTTVGQRFLISVQRAAGNLELFTLDPNAQEPRPALLAKLDSAGTRAGDLRVAGSGDRALVAWTGSLARQSDVWFRTLSTDGSLSDAARWNTDEGSSPQNHGRIASRGGDRAAIAWLDGRSGENQLMARWIGADGRFLCDEITITPRIAGAGTETLLLAGEPMEPSIALAKDGSFLVAWKQMEKRGYRLLAQSMDATGKPQSGLIELDVGEDAPPTFKADIDVTHFGSGYAVAFGHRDRGVFVRTVAAGGSGMGEARLVFEHPLCQNASIVELDGGSLAVAWDISVPGAGNKAVRGRVLGPKLEALHPLVEPPLSLFGDDWDPVLASVPGGGFAIAYTGGKQHSRDVFLRFFDATGAVTSPLVPISSRMNEQDWPAITRLTDGSLCVAFEDDLSAYDHCFVRRVVPGVPQGPALIRGPIRTLNQRETLLNENRVIPRVAALAGGGFAAVWVDCRRSKSTDVRVKILGPGFDAGAR